MTIPTLLCLMVTLISCWHEINRETEYQELKTKIKCLIAVSKRDAQELATLIEKRKEGELNR